MSNTIRKKISVRKLTILLLLEAPGPDGHDRAPITGVTRMQKLVFLTNKSVEDLLRDDEIFTFDFDYSADRYGPADLNLYQDLELLKASSWLEVNGEAGMPNVGEVLDTTPSSGQPLLPEDQEETDIGFDYLMGEHSEEIDLAQAEREYENEYNITDRGTAGLETIRSESGKAEKFDSLAKACKDVKLQYSGLPLSILLRKVYTMFPETTTKSEIRDRILH